MKKLHDVGTKTPSSDINKTKFKNFKEVTTMSGVIIFVLLFICYKYFFQTSEKKLNHKTYLKLSDELSNLDTIRCLVECSEHDQNLEKVRQLIDVNTKQTLDISSEIELKNAQIDFDQKIGFTFYIKTKFPNLITSETMKRTFKEISKSGFESNSIKYEVCLEDNFLIIKNEAKIVYKSLYKSYSRPEYIINIPDNKIDRELNIKYLEVFKPGLWIIDFVKEVNRKYDEIDQIVSAQRNMQEKQYKAEMRDNFSPV